jgi:hypothetical protein
MSKRDFSNRLERQPPTKIRFKSQPHPPSSPKPKPTLAASAPSTSAHIQPHRQMYSGGQWPMSAHTGMYNPYMLNPMMAQGMMHPQMQGGQPFSTPVPSQVGTHGGYENEMRLFDSSKMKAGRLGHYGYLEGRGKSVARLPTHCQSSQARRLVICQLGCSRNPRSIHPDQCLAKANLSRLETMQPHPRPLITIQHLR